MGVLLSLIAALAYGASDFVAGLASRRFASGPVAFTVQGFGLIAAAVTVALFPGVGPTAGALGWGAISGLGSAVGALSFYHGLTIGRMSVVATLSAVLTAVIPAIVGLALGEHLSLSATIGIALAIPAIGFVSWQPRSRGGAATSAETFYGVLAGLGFALVLIALDRAGTRSGAWPLLPGQAISVLLAAPFALHGFRSQESPTRTTLALAIVAGIVGGAANLVYLAATGRGQLATIAVVTSLYPAITIVLARAFLAERWTGLQATGLFISAVAIILIIV